MKTNNNNRGFEFLKKKRQYYLHFFPYYISFFNSCSQKEANRNMTHSVVVHHSSYRKSIFLHVYIVLIPLWNQWRQILKCVQLLCIKKKAQVYHCFHFVFVTHWVFLDNFELNIYITVFIASFINMTFFLFVKNYCYDFTAIFIFCRIWST